MEAIHHISERYQVLFNYDRAIISNIKVKYEPSASQNVDEAISAVLVNTDLKYQMFNQRYVVLYKNDKEGIESLKEMIQHFQKIVDDKSNEVVIRQKIKPTPPLITTLQTGILDSKALSFFISGTVVDQDGTPLIGVNIQIKGTNKGTATDFDGRFAFEEIDENAVLVVSYIGYQTQEVAVAGKSSLSIVLTSDTQLLDEVVVVGYGSVRKKDLTGSVSRISSESFEDQAVTRVEEALQGRASGVSVSRTSGAPGSEIKVRVRGVNSITGSNSPLVVIDGIIGGDLSTINPNDIAAIDVLKDASATAVYGVRGSNGVIVITTKKGSGESKINVNYFNMISTIPQLLPTLAESVGDFARLENLRRTNTGGSPIFSNEEISALEANGGTNYQDEIFRTGISNNLQVSASGSEGKLRYFLSGNYRDEEGIVKTTGYQQFSIRSNLDAYASDRIKVGLNLYASRGETKNDPESFSDSPISLANTWDPTTPVFDPSGQYNLYSVRGIASLRRNPVYVLNESKFENVEERINAALNLNFEITDDLDFTMVAGSQLRNLNIQEYRVEGNNEIPDAVFSTSKLTSYQMSNILTWAKEYDVHNIKITGVQEYTKSMSTSNRYGANDLILPNGFYFAELAPSTGLSIGNNYNDRTLLSYMLRGEYILNNNLFLTATGRYDGTSVFRPGKKWGIFPSVALAYNLNRLVENIETFSTLKLRLGWGEVGNQGISPYGTYATLGIEGYAYDGVSVVPGTFVNGFSNTELTWETTTQTNLGFDIGLMDDRLNLTLDVYKKNTTDLLLLVPVPLTNGGGSTLQNVGEVENLGVDFTGDYDVFTNKNFNWNSSVNFSYIKNEVVSLFGGLEEIEGRFSVPGGTARRANIIQLGEPLGQFSGATFLGTWKSSEAETARKYNKAPGDAKYLRDENGEISFGAIGNGAPQFFWGWSNTVTYKNWDLNVFLQGMNKFDVYNLMKASITGGAGDARSFMAPDQVNQWTPTNESDIPSTVQLFNSSRYVEKGDFVRLSNLNIGYNIKDLAGFGSIKVYVSGQNLFLISSYSGYDPENTSISGHLDQAPSIDAGAYPTPKTFAIGLKARF